MRDAPAAVRETPEAAPQASAPATPATEPANPLRDRRFRRWGRRLGIGVVVLVLGVLAASLYLLGGSTRPTREVRTAYAALEAAGAVPAPPPDRFVVPIPGCRCHSDDPVQIVHHAEYRIRDCRGCH